MNNSEKRAFGAAVIQEIRKRTSKGIDSEGRQFPGYSKEYKESLDFKIAGKSSTVNLRLSGDMMTSLSVLEVNPSNIVIGFDDEEEEAKAAGNILGTYGTKTPNSSKARSFVGLPESVLESIRAEFRRLSPVRQQVTQERPQLFSSFLEGLRTRLFNGN